MPPRLKRASAKTRTPMTTESQSSFRLCFTTAALADFTAMSDILVPGPATPARRYENSRIIKPCRSQLTILQNSFLREAQRMNLLRTGINKGELLFDCISASARRSAPESEQRARLPHRFKSCEHRGEIGAEDIGEIAALLDEHGWQSHPRDRFADVAEAGRGHGQTRERIMLGRVEAEGDHQRARRKRADRPGRMIERLDVAGIAGAGRQRDVEVGAEAGPLAALMGGTPDVRIEGRGIGMDRYGEDVRPRIENALRAVPVVHVDVEDRDALMCEAQ